MPSTPLTFLYAALAENPSCGPSSYEDAVRCGGGPMKCGGNGNDEMAAAEGIEVVAPKKTSEDSVDVGTTSELRMFGRAKGPVEELTPKTVPVTPDSSVELRSKGSDVAGPMMPSTPELNPIEDMVKLKRRTVPLVKKGSFQSTATTTVCSNSSKKSGDSKKSRCSTPDDIEKARWEVLDEDDNPVPTNVTSASLSMSSSALSQPVVRERDAPSPASADVSSLSHPEYQGGAVPPDGEIEDVATPSKLDFSFAPVTGPSFDALCHEHALLQGSEKFQLQPKPAPTGFATSVMFTSEDIDAITNRQVNAYLTAGERKKIGTKVLSAKMKKGRTLAGAKNVCESCNMPLLSAPGEPVEGCAVCPVLKKQVLKKILAAAAPSVEIDASSFAAIQSAEVRTVDLSLGPDESKHRAGGSNGVTFGTNSEDKEPATGTQFTSANIRNKQGFFLNAKQSLADAFKTQSYYDGISCNFNLPLESGDGTSDSDRSADPIVQARDMLWNGATKVSEVLKEGTAKCQEIDFDGGKEAIAVVGEKMVQRAALVPEALRYKSSDVAADVGCRALAFDEVKGNVAHVAGVLAESTGYAAKFCVDEKAAGDIVDSGLAADQNTGIKPVEKGESKRQAQSKENAVIVEDASEDVEEAGIQWNNTVETIDLHLLGEQGTGTENNGDDPGKISNKPFDEESEEEQAGDVPPAELDQTPLAETATTPESKEDGQS